jgi:alkaline phosphatase
MKRNLLTAAAGLVLTLGMLAGCSAPVATAAETAAPKAKPTAAPIVAQNTAASTEKAPKYVFLFIGDGMSHVQINAAEVLLGDNKRAKSL